MCEKITAQRSLWLKCINNTVFLQKADDCESIGNGWLQTQPTTK